MMPPLSVQASKTRYDVMGVRASRVVGATARSNAVADRSPKYKQRTAE